MAAATAIAVTFAVMATIDGRLRRVLSVGIAPAPFVVVRHRGDVRCRRRCLRGFGGLRDWVVSQTNPRDGETADEQRGYERCNSDPGSVGHDP